MVSRDGGPLQLGEALAPQSLRTALHARATTLTVRYAQPSARRPPGGPVSWAASCSGRRPCPAGRPARRRPGPPLGGAALGLIRARPVPGCPAGWPRW
ncbi:hypothetical protein EF910_37030 [Streptomyces sp. WAC07149]|nr:hypothetical protein EF910_37030 [Streptomyces sp. WAC07149]